MTTTDRRTELRQRIARCEATQADYEAIAASRTRQLEQLEPGDPETRDAARELLRQLIHADNCAAEAARYAMYARNELADLNAKRAA